ncbi:MAG: Ni/Fe hydrogenase subunit alpha [Thermomicrobiales bacterium]|nr:Ni/Fe hydrogenase subunit alpha [Thermomicrobiales bacterium]
MTHQRRTIRVDNLARVEGEGGLRITIRDDRVTDVKLRIFEPPRFFEALLRGRHFSEAPDITARICGICPVAYQMSAVHAMEDACGVTVDGPLRALRRMLYCGEWIQSHALHVYLLHAPDFLGYQSAIEMAHDHRDIVERGLELKKIGNELMAVIGGRAVHPINVKVGGFFRAPTRRELEPVAERLKWAREAAIATVRLASTFSFPAFDPDYELVALHHPTEYPLNEGRLVSNRGLDISVPEYADHFVEEHVAHSTALHARLRARGSYLVGPLARFALNFPLLTPLAREVAGEIGLDSTCRNPFKSILVRGVELVFACDEALRLIAAYEEPERPSVDVPPRAGVGHACTEAPRGILYHRYEIDDAGLIQHATIVPPTSQNQMAIEADLLGFVQDRLALPHEELQWQCEQLVRSYDPCISCAAHFLDLDVDRV